MRRAVVAAVIACPVLVVGGCAGTLAAVTVLGAAAGSSGGTGGTLAACTATTTVPGLTAEQATNAAAILLAARTVVGPRAGQTAVTRAAIIAIATAMQESTLRNLAYGDRDSVGLFQQRDAWGTTAQRMDPAQATTMFLTGGHAGQRGLLDIPDWQTLPLTVAAQAVQASATPDAYARWEPLATAAVGGTTGCAGTQDVLDRAATWLTAWHGGPVPYSMADLFGGYRQDCSGYASMALGLPGPGLTTAGLAAHSTPISKDALQPGDLLINPGAGGAGHVVIFEAWTNPAHTTYMAYEQSGDGGTHHRAIPYPYYGTYQMAPYRLG